jgi:hypothetical protein
MKFLSPEDMGLFLAEIGRMDLLGTVNEDFEPTEEMLGSFIQSRKKLVGKLRDFRRSQAAKSGWRGNRSKYMSGIRAYHRSTEGKRFHRELGRWLTTHYPRFQGRGGGILSQAGVSPGLHGESFAGDVATALKAITSAKTNVYIMLEYYRPLYEEVEIREFAYGMLSILDRVEVRLRKGDDLDEHDVNFLFQVVADQSLLNAITEKLGKPVAEVTDLWKSSFDAMKSDESVRFLHLEVVRKLLGGESSEKKIEPE